MHAHSLPKRHWAVKKMLHLTGSLSVGLPVAKWVGGAGIHGSIDYHHPTAVALTSVGGLEIDGYHQAAGNRLPITLGRLEAPTLHRVHGGAIEIAGAAALVQ